MAGTQEGSFYINVSDVQFQSSPLGFHWNIASANGYTPNKAWYLSCKYHFFGFAFQPHGRFGDYWLMFVPIWFPTFLCALSTWLIWRKTKQKVGGRAFPVGPNEVGTV